MKSLKDMLIEGAKYNDYAPIFEEIVDYLVKEGKDIQLDVAEYLYYVRNNPKKAEMADEDWTEIIAAQDGWKEIAKYCRTTEPKLQEAVSMYYDELTNALADWCEENGIWDEIDF